MALRWLDAGLLALHVALSVGGMLLVKAQSAALRAAWDGQGPMAGPLTWAALGAASYAIGFLVWMLVLTRNELSVAYPLAVGATLLASGLAAALLLGEAVGPLRATGMVLILLGVVLIARS